MQEMDTEPVNLKGILKKPKQGEELTELFDKMQIAVVGKEQGNDSDNGVMSDGGDESGDSMGDIDEELAYMNEDPNKNSKKHANFTDLESRAREDMDFPDEMDTPFTDARVRFEKYRGIKSLKNCDWDPYQNLPEDYSKIWRFQSYQAAYKDSVQQTIEEGLPLNGTYINIVLEVAPGSSDQDHFKLS